MEERKQNGLRENRTDYSPSLFLHPSICLPLPAVCIMWLFVYRCNGVRNSPSGFLPAAVVCPQASPPASAATASGFLPLVLPPALARWHRSARLKALSPESKHGPATKRRGAETAIKRTLELAVRKKFQKSKKKCVLGGGDKPSSHILHILWKLWSA